MKYLYIKVTNLLIWSQFIQDKSMLVKDDWKSIVRTMLPMVRITNPFKQIGESEVSNHITYDCQLSENLYVVRYSPDRLSARNSIRIFKSGGDLKVNDNVICKNSGNPDYWKVWGFGGSVVRSFASFSETRKGPSLEAGVSSTLSGDESVTSELNKLELQVVDFVKTGKKIRGISNILRNPLYLMACYHKIKSRDGALTTGLDKATLDGINEQWFIKTAEKMVNGTYKFKPFRRQFIPKPQGGERPLGIPNPRDKIVQEAIRQLLEIVFDRQFQDVSHGFRSHRSCHTALNEIKIKMGSSRWFIEGDIAKCYDKIDHNLLVAKINKVIEDQPFIDLIYKVLRNPYGYDNRVIYPSIIGVPQGGVVSPILSNILLNDLDIAMLEMASSFELGKRRKANPEYTKMIRKSKVNRNLKILPLLGDDSNFKRMKYIRYADDFLVSVIGSKEDCVKIRNNISNYLKNDLKLDLNLNKTKISHATNDGAVFLGHKIYISDISKHKTKYVSRKDGKVLTRVVSRPRMDAPIGKIVNKLTLSGFCKANGNPTRCGRLIHEPLHEIIKSYGNLEKGLINFYSLASNYSRVVARIHYILKYSCALTFASKLKLKTLRKVFRKFGKDLTVLSDGNEVLANYLTPSYNKPKKLSTTKISNPFEYIERVVKFSKRSKTTFGKNCFVCKSFKNIEMHHLKQLRKGKPKDWLTSRMIQINRKQIPVCRNCHMKIHKGQYDSIKLS
nr:hypothetical protein Ahn.fas.Ore.mt_002 [Ahnfeltia fastigiata]